MYESRKLAGCTICDTLIEHISLCIVQHSIEMPRQIIADPVAYLINGIHQEPMRHIDYVRMQSADIFEVNQRDYIPLVIHENIAGMEIRDL